MCQHFFFPPLLLFSCLVSFVHSNEEYCIPSTHYELSNGVMMPRVSFGTAALPRGVKHEEIIKMSLQAGFRSFDTAQAKEWYDEASVAHALIGKDSVDNLVSIDDLFITTKIHPRDLGYDSTVKAVESSIERFGGKPLDLVLLHYSRCFIGVCTEAEVAATEAAGGWKSSWKALNEFMQAGKVRAIGVSNFDISELKQVDPKPHAVQNWFDPFRQDRHVLSWCHRHGVAYTSYSTLGGQWMHQTVEGGNGRRRLNPIYDNPTLQSIAASHGGDITAVVLSWALQRDVLVLPRSTSFEHMKSNAKFMEAHETTGKMKSVFLTQKELAMIDALDGSIDMHSECRDWASTGECVNNPAYMYEACRAACGVGAAEPLSCGRLNTEEEGSEL